MSLSAHLHSTASRRNVEEHAVMLERYKLNPNVQRLRGRMKKCTYVTSDDLLKCFLKWMDIIQSVFP